MTTPPVPGPPTAPQSAVHAQLERTLRELDDLGERPVGEHVAAYDAVHRGLQDALAALDGG